MLDFKVAYMILAACGMAAAQAVNIKGTVKDAAGAAVAGAVVKLERTGYQAVTGADGGFTITESSTAVLAAPRGDARGDGFAARGRGRLWILSAGERYSLDGRAGTAKGPGADGVTWVSPLAKPAASSEPFPDVLRVVKAGFLDYRTVVAGGSATGLDIRLVAAAGTVTDADGNVYQTVKLGAQEWTVTHLRSTKYNDGTAIPLIAAQAQWANRATPAMCHAANMTDPDSIRKWGALYNWHAVNTRKLAPAGWRVPGDADWMALQSWLIANGYNHDGTTAGNKIGKAMAARTDWNGSTVAGAVGNEMSRNNRSGFDCMPIGYRDQGGNFTNRGARCIMSSTDNKEGLYGWFADVDNASPGLRYSDDWMSMGFAIRLIRN